MLRSDTHYVASLYASHVRLSTHHSAGELDKLLDLVTKVVQLVAVVVTFARELVERGFSPLERFVVVTVSESVLGHEQAVPSAQIALALKHLNDTAMRTAGLNRLIKKMRSLSSTS